MTNLQIAFPNLAEEKRKKIAKESFQNLAITSLEFLSLKKNGHRIRNHIHFEGGEEVFDLLKKKQGIVFLSAHQANWEIPFIAITTQFKGIAIGRPIKNRRIYNWVLSIRTSFGGKIVMPKNAIKEGLKALSQGEFVGIVGDQALPESTYSYPLFGTRAWTSTAPALLAYRTKSPLVVVMTRREGLKYAISGSSPLWPDLSRPIKEEIPRLMNEAMGYLEKSIEKRPSEWLWQHDRWKQQKIDHVKREFRFGHILVVIPETLDPDPLFPIFEEIYPRSFISYFLPKKGPIPSSYPYFFYEKKEELFVRDYRYQLVFNFLDCPKLTRHFKQLGAFKVVTLESLQKNSSSLKDALVNMVCKENASRSLFY